MQPGDHEFTRPASPPVSYINNDIEGIQIKTQYDGSSNKIIHITNYNCGGARVLENFPEDSCDSFINEDSTSLPERPNGDGSESYSFMSVLAKLDANGTTKVKNESIDPAPAPYQQFKQSQSAPPSPPQQLNGVLQQNVGPEHSKDTIIGKLTAPIPKIEIVEEPENTYRARYESEGCKGPIHGASETGFPSVKIVGYVGEVTINVFVVTSEYEPHLHTATGPGSSKIPCNEVKLENGTTAIQMVMKPTDENDDMVAVFDQLSIRRVRNWEADRELRKRGIEPATWKTKKKEAKLAFQAIIAPIVGHHDGYSLLIYSRPFLCTAPSGNPEIWWCSQDRGNPEGGEEMGFIGKKFSSGFKVRFFSKEDDGNTWEAYAEIDKGKSNLNACVVKIPAYKELSLTENVSVNVEIRVGSEKEPRCSEPWLFTYITKKFGQCENCIQIKSHLQKICNGDTTDEPTFNLANIKPEIESPKRKRGYDTIVKSTKSNGNNINLTQTVDILQNFLKSPKISRNGSLSENGLSYIAHEKNLSVVTPPVKNNDLSTSIAGNRLNTTTIFPPMTSASMQPYNCIKTVIHQVHPTNSLITVPSITPRTKHFNQEIGVNSTLINPFQSPVLPFALNQRSVDKKVEKANISPNLIHVHTLEAKPKPTLLTEEPDTKNVASSILQTLSELAGSTSQSTETTNFQKQIMILGNALQSLQKQIEIKQGFSQNLQPSTALQIQDQLQIQQKQQQHFSQRKPSRPEVQQPQTQQISELPAGTQQQLTLIQQQPLPSLPPQQTALLQNQQQTIPQKHNEQSLQQETALQEQNDPQQEQRQLKHSFVQPPQGSTIQPPHQPLLTLQQSFQQQSSIQSPIISASEFPYSTAEVPSSLSFQNISQIPIPQHPVSLPNASGNVSTIQPCFSDGIPSVGSSAILITSSMQLQTTPQPVNDQSSLHSAIALNNGQIFQTLPQSIEQPTTLSQQPQQLPPNSFQQIQQHLQPPLVQQTNQPTIQSSISSIHQQIQQPSPMLLATQKQLLQSTIQQQPPMQITGQQMQQPIQSPIQQSPPMQPPSQQVQQQSPMQQSSAMQLGPQQSPMQLAPQQVQQQAPIQQSPAMQLTTQQMQQQSPPTQLPSQHIQQQSPIQQSQSMPVVIQQQSPIQQSQSMPVVIQQHLQQTQQMQTTKTSISMHLPEPTSMQSQQPFAMLQQPTTYVNPVLAGNTSIASSSTLEANSLNSTSMSQSNLQQKVFNSDDSSQPIAYQPSSTNLLPPRFDATSAAAMINWNPPTINDAIASNKVGFAQSRPESPIDMQTDNGNLLTALHQLNGTLPTSSEPANELDAHNTLINEASLQQQIDQMNLVVNRQISS